MASPLFDIEGDGLDQGYDATTNTTVHLRLRSADGVNSVQFQVWDPTRFDPARDPQLNPPRKSKGAPLVDLDNGVASGKTLSPVGLLGELTLHIEEDAAFSAWIVRAVVNGGQTQIGGRVIEDPSLVHERMIVVRDELGARPIIATETTQYEPDGWAGAFVPGTEGGAGGFLRRTLIRAGTGTHVCGSDATHARLRGGGGGGAGGGAIAPAGQCSVGSASTAAGVFDVLIELTAGLSIPYVVGAKGIGVNGAPGGDGNDTTATYNGITYAGRKGTGGIVGQAGTTPQMLGLGTGGRGENGDQNIAGGSGTMGYRESGTSGLAGNGGDSAEAPGPGGASSNVGGSVSGDGADGQFSSGGSGAINCNGIPADGNRGGHGGEGFLWAYEYKIAG